MLESGCLTWIAPSKCSKGAQSSNCIGVGRGGV